jgi:hypothetical protein
VALANEANEKTNKKDTSFFIASPLTLRKLTEQKLLRFIGNGV